ncbi:DUF6279 family lipoprotein [Lacisediminimonas sp.]|uniref:DUF6279 family lipoprotein n=1 Tax=Lacisediminimonas sp. TaxID=3060582 RepID=UPI0027256444|nr:DUF6279 family lipoprotein [Lacisediminimonas sp.]MDO8300666.1 DUF6279 family lipoprotein [Lacisediminimonas sp.]
MRNISTHRSVFSAKTLLLALLVALLAGCGMARMAYNNGESLSYFWLDRYVDFTDAQKHWVQPEIDEIFAWHRRSQLPDYIGFLQTAQRQLQEPVSEAALKSDADMIRKRLLLIMDQSLPMLADIALSLQPNQIAHIQKKFSSNNDDYRKENLRGDVEQRQRARYKRALKQAEYFFGNLDGAQEKQLRQLSDARPLNNELVLRARQRRQKEIIALLNRIRAEQPSKEVAVLILGDYVKRSLDHFGDAQTKAFYQAYEAATIHQVAGLINGTTARQKEHAVHNLQRWIDDFRRLSGS